MTFRHSLARCPRVPQWKHRPSNPLGFAVPAVADCTALEGTPFPGPFPGPLPAALPPPPFA
eukprot:10527836-Heterocapsa_arctica.AAC.1